MIDAIVELVLAERIWLFASMLLSLIIVLVSHRRRRVYTLPYRFRILWAMNLYYGCMIGTMAFGHLLAVTLKMVQGRLEGSWLVLYPLGLALAIPAWSLAFGVSRYVNAHDRYKNRLLALNAWLGIYLVSVGLVNFPLAAPAALNVAYQLHTRRAVGWTIVTVAIAANLVLFVGSALFLASGQTFEQFQGLE